MWAKRQELSSGHGGVQDKRGETQILADAVNAPSVMHTAGEGRSLGTHFCFLSGKCAVCVTLESFLDNKVFGKIGKRHWIQNRKVWLIWYLFYGQRVYERSSIGKSSSSPEIQ